MKKFNFKKISAIGASAILAGMTLGLAAAANYPAPFVSGSNANVAIVYGTGAGVSSLDLIQAGNIQTDLQSKLGSSSSSSSTTTISGEGVSLNSGSSKIWLNTSLNTAITTITKTDLPTILAQTTFSGNVDSKITSTITVGSSDKVVFDKQPSSSDDPVIGIALNSSSTGPLYTAAITMPAIAFNSTDSEGETITLFGKDYVVSTATTGGAGGSLVLFSSAEQKTLVLGGSNPVPSTSVTVGGKTYTIELVTGSGTTSATVSVSDGTTVEQKSIDAGASKKINGLDVAVKSVTESTAINTITAELLIGSDKLTFTNGTQVTKGSDDNPVDGTYVTFTGTPDALTGLSVAVYAPDTSTDALLAGGSFVDPVFGSFKVDFSGLNVPMDSSDRDTIKIDKSGDKGMSLSMTDSDGNAKTFDFIYNASNREFLSDSNGYNITVVENRTIYQNSYVVIGNEDYGHLLQLTRIYNNTGSDYSKDAVTFQDVISGDNYEMDATAEGTGRLTVDGRQYTIVYAGTGDTGNVTIKYPTSDTSVSEKVVYPTIQTKQGALVQLYEPLNLTLPSTGLIGFSLPNGDGYTTLTLTATNGNGTWSLSGAGTTSALIGFNGTSVKNSTTLTVGQLTYHLNSTSTVNMSRLLLVDPSTGLEIATPGVVLVEAKDDLSHYEDIIAYTDESAGTSSDPVGIGTVVSTSPTWYSKTLQSDSDIVQDVDWWGTLVTEDSNTASQKVVTFSYPKSQVYADVMVGGVDSSVSGGTTSSGGALGDVLVKDTEVSSVSSTNLMVVGGSCINSAAATLVGGAYCGAMFTQNTGVGSGQFLIKGYATSTLTSKVALLVAGYEAADTVNAATYLRTQTVDTSKSYLGTSATSATLQTSSA